MTLSLSQIVARNSFYDVEIPSEGKWKVYMVIQNGKVEQQDVTEQRKEEEIKR